MFLCLPEELYILSAFFVRHVHSDSGHQVLVGKGLTPFWLSAHEDTALSHLDAGTPYLRPTPTLGNAWTTFLTVLLLGMLNITEAVFKEITFRQFAYTHISGNIGQV